MECRKRGSLLLSQFCPNLAITESKGWFAAEARVNRLAGSSISKTSQREDEEERGNFILRVQGVREPKHLIWICFPILVYSWRPSRLTDPFHNMRELPWLLEPRATPVALRC
jgi:hypothetical protein